MSLRLPPSASPLRELFTLDDLVDPFRLPSLRRAYAAAKCHLRDEPAVRAVNALIMYVDGTVRLVRFGREGGIKVLWTFGNPAE